MTPANDNAALADYRAPRAAQHATVRFRTLRAYAVKPAINLRGLIGMQRGERHQLRAAQAAAYAALSRNHNALSHASTLARSEIALAFASRWADIRRMPAALRAAAVAALKAEEAAALSARVSHHLSLLHTNGHSERIALSRQHSVARRALAYRHKLAWAGARTQLARPPPRQHKRVLPPACSP